MRRLGVGIAVALGVQAALVAGYVLVERARAPEAPFRFERLDQVAPALRVESGAGEGAVGSATIGLDAYGDRPVLVHFWATWCVPCREELPGLLEAAREDGVPLLAVTDEPWEVVAGFFGGAIPSPIVRDPVGDAARRYGVSGLPDTFVVDRGRIVARMGGPRAWETGGARRFLGSLAE